jgi:predicted TIM-barrel fold metal-dependent hydrolase
MQMDDMILVSTDDHTIEPPEVFDRHAPASLKDRMPKVVKRNGMQLWAFEDKVMPNLANNAVVGRAPEAMGFEPASYDQMRRACYDVHARVDDMSVNGVLAGLNFPSFPGVYGSQFLTAKDKDLAYAAIQAYNDWAIDEWCAAHPERFIPCALVPLWDPQLIAKEIKRVKLKGCNAITAPPNPVPDGLPNWHQDYWDPMWAACDENKVVVNLHISDATNAVPSQDTPIEAFFACMGVTLYSTAVDLVYSPIFDKFHNVKIALSEGGAGWAANAVERMDLVHMRHRKWTGQDFKGRLPSEIFRKHFLTCIVAEDRAAVLTREIFGLETMTWECDYPHAEALWPNSPEVLWKTLDGLTDNEIDRITHLNALEAFDFDPFKHRPREKCTVGALRAEAKHVSTAYLDTGGIPPKKKEGAVSLRDLVAQLSEAYNLHIGGAD